jgi:hypothetical protein
VQGQHAGGVAACAEGIAQHHRIYSGGIHASSGEQAMQHWRG